MIIKYDWIETETLKAGLFVRDDLMAWIPKSCFKVISDKEAEVKDGFVVNWKDESGVIIKTEGELSAEYSPRTIVVTEQNLNELWIYL